MPHYLKQIILAIKHDRFYHAFLGPNYVASCQSDRVAECYRIGGYRVVYLSGGR